MDIFIYIMMSPFTLGVVAVLVACIGLIIGDE